MPSAGLGVRDRLAESSKFGTEASWEDLVVSPEPIFVCPVFGVVLGPVEMRVAGRDCSRVRTGDLLRDCFTIASGTSSSGSRASRSEKESSIEGSVGGAGDNTQRFDV